MTRKTIALSAGGTGGHLFPAEALAAELIARGHRVVIITDKRGQAFKSLGDKVEIHTVRAATLKPGVITKLKALFEMGAGILSAARLLRNIRPDIVVGFGGYPSFPGVFAGQKMGIPTILHEQNAVLGKANAWLAGGAENIAASMPNTLGVKPAHQSKVVVTGNPVRQAIVEAGKTSYAPPVNGFNILITGGSQAAGIFGQIVPEAVALLPEDARKRLNVMHQCRENDLDATAEKYTGAGVRAEVKTFFNNMAERLKDCHLFIGRSGASTVAELAAAGRPAIFVPLRHADMQQKHNAEALSLKGGAWLVMQEDFTPALLADKIAAFMKDPSLLEKAAGIAKNCGRPDAAKKLADTVENKMKELKR